MTVSIDFEALHDAVEWVSAGAPLAAQAHVRRSDGNIFWRGDGVDEDEVPGDKENGFALSGGTSAG